MIRLLINNGGPGGFVDYTQYVLPSSISVEDSINTPTLISFTLANSSGIFVAPVRSAYVKFISTTSPLSATGTVITTGFVTNTPEFRFLGMGPAASNFRFQVYECDIKVTSDEYLLNIKAVPFIAAFINRTMGQILMDIAETLAPGYFDTTNIQSGDMVPYFAYNPESKWSDVAKEFADQAQFRYEVIDKKIHFAPYGDAPLGVSYDETTQTQKQFVPHSLKTGVLSVPLVNDALVVGAVEPQQNHDDYFVGDGFTGNFPLHYTMFHGVSDLLLQDDWTEDVFNQSMWTIKDPFGQFILAGALNSIGVPGPLGQSYILAKNGLELGGHLVVQHGEFQFNDTSTGIIGGIYNNTGTLMASTCVAGFDVRNAGTTVIVTASGASGIQITPVISGALFGTSIVTVPNHHYILQTSISARRWSRYNQIYRTLAGTPFGDEFLPALAEVTFTVTDIDLAQAYNIATLNNPFVPQYIPTITKYTASGLNIPTFGAYALLNSVNLNLTVNYTLASQPPQGLLQVASLTGAQPTNALALTGGQLPPYNIFDPLAEQVGQPLGPVIHYPLGFGFQDATATIAKKGDNDQLEFYSDRIPGVGGRIRLQAWQAGHALSRVQDPVSIAAEAALVGDDGLRSAIITDLKPTPRTSDECDLAAEAVILDREKTQYDGSYLVESYFWDNTQDYPKSGRFLNVTAPQRGISGAQFLVRSVKTTVLELWQEILQFEISFGQDLYLEKLLRRFIDQPKGILGPNETAMAPDPQNLPPPGSPFTTYLDNLNDASVTLITGTQAVVDLGATPVTGVEVRRSDTGWASTTQNLIGVFTTQQFTLPRARLDQTWYMREVNGTQTSRFTRVLRVNYPMVPLQPSSVAVNFAVVAAPVLTVALPLQFDRNIYGVQIDTGALNLTPCQALTVVSSDPTDNRTIGLTGTTPQGNTVTEYVILNGTTPGVTVNVFCTLSFAQVFNGLVFADTLNNWLDAIQLAFFPVWIYLSLSDSNQFNWADYMVPNRFALILSDDNGPNWADDIVVTLV
jgi:hypothetical protein